MADMDSRLNDVCYLLTLFESPVSKVIYCGEDGTNVLEAQALLTFKVIITSGPEKDIRTTF